MVVIIHRHRRSLAAAASARVEADRLNAIAAEADLVIDPAYLQTLSDSKVEQLLKTIADKRGASLPTNEANHLVAHLRREYPFESIRDRIPKRHPNSKRVDPIVLSPQAKKDLEDYEAVNFRAARTHGDDVRSLSLQLLHEDQVRDFVARDGNGYMRTPPPSAIHLALPDSPYIGFDSGPELPEQRCSDPVALPENTPRINLILESAGYREGDYHRSYQAYKQWAEKNNPLMMPDQRQLRYIHRQSHDSFLHGYLIGYFKSPDAVAGFRGHQVRSRPIVDVADKRWIANDLVERLEPDERAELDPSDPFTQAPRDAIWLLTELRLVSLLMHAEPAVYDSNDLPNMANLDSTNTVPLDDFESRSLEKLYAGDHIQIEPHLNEIRMLGAIRCSKTCLDCHDAKRGELLGAFTYTLTRKIPR